MKAPTVDPLEQEVARATKAVQEVETQRDSVDAALASARDEDGAAKKTVTIEMQAAGAAKARAWQHGTPAPSLAALETAERAARVTAQVVAVLESARAEIERRWTDARLALLAARMERDRAAVTRLQADFTQVGVKRTAANAAFDQEERAITAQRSQAHDQLARDGREADDLRRHRS